MSDSEVKTEQLLSRAREGDASARNHLLDRHRTRLRTLVAMRIAGNLAGRFDPSDVVQDALADADGRLNDFLDRRPLPFYLWLRELTLERLVDLHRKHVYAQKRSVRREEQAPMAVPDGSMNELANRFVSRSSSPSRRVQREELREAIRAAIEQLSENDREVLVLRHLEHLTTREIAIVLNLTESAVKVRHLRALQRLRDQLGDKYGESDL